MINDKFIVCVSASFEKKEALLNTIKKYSQHSDERFAYWDEFAFTTDILPECDALLVFNSPGENIRASCCPEKVIAFMMEPGIISEHPWMFRNLEQYYKVYSPLVQSLNTVQSHGYLGWHFDYDHQGLTNLDLPQKTRLVSCIASGLTQLEGHRHRLDFIKKLEQHFPQVDFFGRERHFLPDKMDGLLPYRYSIAIENCSQPHYFTEKINDCFLAYTVPVYFGCKNISQYFPEKSFIQIDLADSAGAMKKIRFQLEHDDWESRIEALKEARELVLNKYQPLAGAATILRGIQPVSSKREILLRPVYPALLKRIKNRLYKLLERERNPPSLACNTG